MPLTNDYSALTTADTPAEIAEFRERVRQRPEYNASGQVIAVVVLLIVLALFGGFVLITVVGGIALIGSAAAQGSPAVLLSLIFPCGLVALFVLLVVIAARSVLGGRRWELWLRFERFAERNNLVFSPSDANPQYPGAIFGAGSSRTAIDHFRSADERFLDYGNYRYTTGSGKNRRTHSWGFLALALDRSLPHMVLDSLANNGLFGTSLSGYDRKQVLSLEGDFNRYFTLYCPQEYERDALYVFTPDLMALLIDNAAPFDVEIIDTWMFVYSATPFDFSQPAVHHRLLSIVDTVGAKTLTQTDRYVDVRVGDFTTNTVAPPGQRLTRRVPVALIVIIAVILVGPFLVTPLLLLLLGQ